MENGDKLLTVEEACEILRVRPWAIRDYILAGKLKAHKLGKADKQKNNRRQWRIWKSDLIAFLEGGK